MHTYHPFSTVCGSVGSYGPPAYPLVIMTFVYVHAITLSQDKTTGWWDTNGRYSPLR